MDSKDLTNAHNSNLDRENSSALSGIYQNLSFINTKNISKALGRSLQLTSSTFSSWFKSKESNLKRKVFSDNMALLKGKIDNIPENEVCEAPPEIGVPITDKLSYVTNEHIRNAYMNLLTKACSDKTSNMAHPSFEGIIGRLSVDEAKIIQFLINKIEINFLHYRLHTEGNGWYYRKRFATGIEFDIILDFPNNMEAYLTNLMTLGILSYTLNTHKIGENIYTPLTNRYAGFEAELRNEVASNPDLTLYPYSQYPKEMLEYMRKASYTSLEIEKGFFEITTFGQLFIKACTE